MESSLVAITILFSFFSLFWIVWPFWIKSSTASGSKQAGKVLPPGPVQAPIFGSLFKLGDKPHVSITELAARYGPVMSLRLGRLTTVVVSSAAAAREVLQKNDRMFAGRSVPDSVRVLGVDELSMAWIQPGPLWRRLRYLCNTCIFNSHRLDASRDLRRRKIEDLIAHVDDRASSGEPVDIGKSQAAQEFKNLISAIIQGSGKPNIVDFFPILRPLDPQGIRREMRSGIGKLHGIFEQRIRERQVSRATTTSGYQKRNDFLDALLDQKENGGELSSDIGLKSLFALFRNPKAMARARADLHDTIDPGREVEESDIPRLPYLQAILKETLRLHPAAPLILHRAVCDGEISGYSVPKDTRVIVNIWAICRDGEVWEDPTCFKPERFLQSKVDYLGQHFEFIPFGGGRRICPGMPLAIRMVNLMLATLLHSFAWELPIGMKAKDLDMTEKFGLTLRKSVPLLASLAVLFSFFFLFWIVWRLLNKSSSTSRSKLAGKVLPPGPVPAPIFGSLFKLGDKPHVSLTELAARYGPVVRLRLGRVTTVVVSSAATAREVLQKHDQTFAGRIVTDWVRELGVDELSMVWAQPGPLWRRLRSLCNTCVFSSQRLDAGRDLRRRKIEDLIAHVDNRASSGKAFKDLISALIEEGGKPNIVDFFPILRPLDPQGIRREMKSGFGKLYEIFEQRIRDRQVTRATTMTTSGYQRRNDFLEALLDQKEINGAELSPMELKSLFADLFVAGTSTSSDTVEWAMAELLLNPEAMAQAITELHDTIDPGREVEESDIARLPYLQAIVKETLRLHPAAPLVLHRAICDGEISSYSVPKDTRVIVNVWAISRDGEIWEDPTCFKPERFLDSKVDYIGQHFEFIPFGAGRRMCPGMPLAIRMVNLMLASLLHSFAWELPRGMTGTDLDMTEKFGLTLQKSVPLLAVPSKQ
ncbi:hypothetical protein H6P81_017397 [Aristolochia fimbriata]|uniref:Cytochrome P450 n=1 Tax=Aristolochia fimbriata TaxID=158543 RepID=A0AAV7E2C7_ARIFI|nr:hypothetical protein H6P81_017397 [Aristolochia fimbriata]